MKSILLIADYFGPWPPWMGLFLASCAANSTVNWLIHADSLPPANTPPNVRIVTCSREQYCRRVSDALGIKFAPYSMYNICNLRPAFGEIYAREIFGYDTFGWCDIDIVFGDLRRFLTEPMLSCGLVSMSGRICTGHLTLVQNETGWRSIFRAIPGWVGRMSDPGPCAWTDSLDEAWLSRLCSPHLDLRAEYAATGIAANLVDRFRENNYFAEQWVTPFVPGPWRNGAALHPEVWYWRGGRVTNRDEPGREYPYLHLMNFKAPRYVDPVLYASRRTWIDGAIYATPTLDSRGDVFQIDRLGVHRLGVVDVED